MNENEESNIYQFLLSGDIQNRKILNIIEFNRQLENFLKNKIK